MTSAQFLATLTNRGFEKRAVSATRIVMRHPKTEAQAEVDLAHESLDPMSNRGLDNAMHEALQEHAEVLAGRLLPRSERNKPKIVEEAPVPGDRVERPQHHREGKGKRR